LYLTPVQRRKISNIVARRILIMENNSKNNSISTENEMQVPATEEKKTATTSPVGKDKNATEEKLTLIDELIKIIVETICNFVNGNDTTVVSSALTSILHTIAEINRLGPDQTTCWKIDGVRYDFCEYMVTPELQNLVSPAKVCASAEITSYDLSNHEKWLSKRGQKLTPTDFAIKLRVIQSKLHTNIERKPMVRPEVEMLSEAVKFAVQSEKLPSRNQNSIRFLRQSYDDAAYDKATEWAKVYGSKMFK
jgi:hypothetical protein